MLRSSPQRHNIGPYLHKNGYTHTRFTIMQIQTRSFDRLLRGAQSQDRIYIYKVAACMNSVNLYIRRL